MLFNQLAAPALLRRAAVWFKQSLEPRPQTAFAHFRVRQKRMHYAAVVLLFISVCRAGIWGIPHGYVITQATDVDRAFISATLNRIAQKHELKDRLAWVSVLWTFAYYMNDEGTIQARTEGPRVIVDSIFLAKKQGLAIEIDHYFTTEFVSRFGDRVTSSERGHDKPNSEPSQPTAVAAPSADEALSERR